MERRGGAGAAAVTALVVTAAIAAGAIGCSSSSVPQSRRATRHGCLPPNESAASTRGPYRVGQRTVTFVDHHRTTAAVPARHLPAKPDRTLPTLILYPAAAGARPAAGVFPLVEFSHGSNGTPEFQRWQLSRWAAAGYVVVAPRFPLTSAPSTDIEDFPNQPADVSFVITQTLRLSRRSGDPLHGHVAPGCLAVAGHSLGAITTFGVAYNSCCADRRIRAVVTLAGVAAPFPHHGNYDHPPHVPLLLVHGDADTNVPIKGSQDAFAQLHVPRYFVTVRKGNHVSILFPPQGTVIALAVVGFLDAELKGDPTGLTWAQRAVDASGQATWQAAG